MTLSLVHPSFLLAVADPAQAWAERLPLQLRDLVLSWLPAGVRPLASGLLAAAAILVVFGLLFAFLTLAERKILGRIQNRPGPNRTGPGGLLQPFADGIKMIIKEDIVPSAADRVLHFLAPVVLVAFSLMAFAALPYGRHLVPVDLESGVLYFFAVGAGTELAVFMAGWASHNKYALLAAMRALAQLISYELPLLLSVVPAVALAGSLAPMEIAQAQGFAPEGWMPGWHVFTPCGLAGLAIFFVSALAESNRSPFDLPEAESELIAGHLTEYSGFKYALFFMAEYFGMTALCGLGVTLFLGGWQAPLPALEFIPSYAWFLAKLLGMLGAFIWIRGTLPRLRIDQLMRLSWKLLVPLALANLAVTAFWILSEGWLGNPGVVLRWALSAVVLVASFFLLGRRLSAGLGPRTYRYAP